MAEPSVRILFFARVAEEGEARFLDAYDSIRDRVAAADGHLGEELCQSADDPQQWLITSEWATAGHYATWARAHGFSQLSDPITRTTVERVHRRFLVRRGTPRR
ncbi:antibiotic biosynthesis monooxygenase family protein [Actinomadura fibrosa]|uniref:Antibiotic biosynthesis monooxygenase family protein n=1 Tax=Actinomadura fibrosa TaxID=111802 RepID=A0ABW2Y099_9ACTN|nr:antibiotic biosynthesis monooxygenase family protein [Actinomadura fibrosa]